MLKLIDEIVGDLNENIPETDLDCYFYFSSYYLTFKIMLGGEIEYCIFNSESDFIEDWCKNNEKLKEQIKSVCYSNLNRMISKLNIYSGRKND